MINLAPGASEHFMWCVVSPHRAAMLERVRGSGFIDVPPDDDLKACCCFDHDAPDHDLGFLHFNAEDLTRAILVHEATHAALHFIMQHVMSSARVEAMGEEETQAYFDEALAQTVEVIFAQLERRCFNAEGSHGWGWIKSTPHEPNTEAEVTRKKGSG